MVECRPHLLYPDSLEVDEAQPLADVIADDYEVWSEQFPAFRAGCIEELEAVLSFSGADIKHKGLVYIPQYGDWNIALEIWTALADP